MFARVSQAYHNQIVELFNDPPKQEGAEMAALLSARVGRKGVAPTTIHLNHIFHTVINAADGIKERALKSQGLTAGKEGISRN